MSFTGSISSVLRASVAARWSDSLVASALVYQLITTQAFEIHGVENMCIPL